MDINKNCKLFLKDIYSYDISACHYNILKSLNYNISNIEKDDKLKRNIQIGKLMKNNLKLTNLIRTTTESLIDEYIIRNKILKDDIIIRQYDGFITTKLLKETTDQYLPIDLKEIFSIFIISSDRTMFIATDGINYSIKGIPYRYEKIDKIYERILKINYANKYSIFVELQNIKDEILNSLDPLLYCIPLNDNKYNIFLKEYGQFEISDSLSKVLDVNDIDKEKYFNFYFKPFFESIVIEFI